MVVVSRDLSRFPSEIFSIGKSDYKIVFSAPGWLGRWLRFEGTAFDLRPPVSWAEVLEMITLAQVEREEEEDAKSRSE